MEGNAPRLRDALLMPRRSILFAVLPAVLLANPAPGQPRSAVPDSMARVVSREFELYGPTAEDVRKANDEIRVAITQFESTMGEHPRKMAFVLFRSAAEAGRFDARPLTKRGLEVMPWVLPAGASATGAPGDLDNPDPLGHEAGHRFLIAYAEHALAEAGKGGLRADTASATPNAAAGTHPDVPALPDWLDEAVAGLCERPSYQRNRMVFMREHADQRIPFDEFLQMRRPAPPPLRKSGKAASKAGAKPSAPDRAAIFNAQALSLARFIAHGEEDRFIGTIVEGVLRGRTVGDVMNTSQNLHSKPDVLEKEWLAWIQDPANAP
jgi:hypothetical protein